MLVYQLSEMSTVS